MKRQRDKPNHQFQPKIIGSGMAWLLQIGLACCKEQVGGVAPVYEFKNQDPMVLQKVCGALGNTLVSFCNKTNSCLQMNILAWLEKFVAWKLSIYEFSIREKEGLDFPRETGVQSKGRGNCERQKRGKDEGGKNGWF
ncbi:unnamed protein product [Prunus armeniaca]